MEKVAHFLQVEAMNRLDLEERDTFGRSAYNRYYYATYLCVRDAFATMNVQWETAPHKSYPAILDGKIKKTLSASKSKANRIKDTDLTRHIDIAIRSALELSKIMERGYSVRVAADYNRNVRVDFGSGARFSLSGIDISEAHKWPERARVLTLAIKAAWKQIHA